jgi:hypothetical protein
LPRYLLAIFLKAIFLNKKASDAPTTKFLTMGMGGIKLCSTAMAIRGKVKELIALSFFALTLSKNAFSAI